MTRDELEQRLWELEYGLLSDEDAAALRAQIAGDAAVGQLHERVRAQLSRVAQAARIEAPRVKMRVPGGAETGSSLSAVPRPARSVNPSARIKRSANWSLGVATSLLIGLLGWTSWRSAIPESRKLVENTQTAARQKPYLIVVDAPQQLSREAKNPIAVSTMAADGTPQPAELKLRLEDQKGSNYFYKDVTTDNRGRALVELPGTATDTAKLSFAVADGEQPGLQVDVAAADTQYATHLSTDKPRYRPGDSVRYRSVTLSRFGLKADRDLSVEFQITDPVGQEVAGSKVTGTTEQGVGNGELSLSAEAAPGQYTLVARSPQRVFPEVQRDFTVQLPTPRQYDIDVDWSDAFYSAGGRAQGNLAVRTPGGQPASDVKLNLRGFVDGRQVELSAAEVATDSAGKAVVQFGLPTQIAASEGELGIQAGAQDVVWKKIPLQADQVQVDFYPEGGDLTAGVENRVYFHCHDFEGRTVAVRGRVVDSADRLIAAVATEHDGRSAFRFTPEPGASYALVIDDPPTIKSRPGLPPVVEQSRLVLDAGAGVFDGDAPVHMKLRSRAAPADFLLVAYCRGVMVGQRAGTASDFVDGLCELDLPVIAEAAGVLRVTVFDYSKQPPEPLAERLVYRHPQQKLNVEWAGLLPMYAPGATVNGQVVTTDESGKPVSAALGISAVDTTILHLAGRPAPRMTTQFMLLGDVDRPEKLEDANVYLSAEPTAANALDLLLGTQGWRRFDRIPVSRMAGLTTHSREGLALRHGGDYDTDAFGKGLAVLPAAGPSNGPVELGRLAEAADDAPRRFDNRMEVEALGEKSAEILQKNPQPASPIQRGNAHDWIVAAGFGLALIAVISAVIRQYPTRNTVFAGISVAGGLIGLFLLVSTWTWFWPSHPERLASGGSSGPLLRDVDSFAVPAESAGTNSVPEKNLPQEKPSERAAGFGMSKDAAQLGDFSRAAKPASPSAAPEPASAATPSPLPSPSRLSAGAPVPVPPPGPSAPSTLDPAPRPVSASGAQKPVAEKVDRPFGGILSPEKDRSLKRQEEERQKAQRPEAAWRRSGRGPMVEDKPTPESVAAGARSKFKGVESRLESAGGMLGGNPAGFAGSPGLLRKAAPTSSTPEPTDPKATDSTTQLYERFTVRRYARMGVKKKSDSTANDFTESVYWDPLVTTDEQGRANFAFVLPDTATTFRILAEGHHDGRLGDAEQNVVARSLVEP